jgi:aryl-alcohol dehydrogenase-like predicted oxidoreductase
MERILKTGMARFVGLSNFHRTEMERCRNLVPIVANEVAYNLLDRRWERELFAAARDLGIGVAAYSPLAHGLLSGRYRPDHRFSPDDWRVSGRTLASPLYLVGENFRRNLKLLENLREPASRHNLTVAQLALAWALRDPVVSTTITSPRNVDQVEESAGAAAAQLSSELLTIIEEVAASAAGLIADLPR